MRDLPTLREYIACQCMAGVLQAQPDIAPEQAARRVRELADAMLAEFRPQPMRLAVEAAHGAAEDAEAADKAGPAESSTMSFTGSYDDDFSQLAEKYDFANQ